MTGAARDLGQNSRPGQISPQILTRTEVGASENDPARQPRLKVTHSQTGRIPESPKEATKYYLMENLEQACFSLQIMII